MEFLDGWHKVYDCHVVIEGGKVIRGIKNGVTCYPYEYERALNCWINISGKITLPAFRAGYKRGSKILK